MKNITPSKLPPLANAFFDLLSAADQDCPQPGIVAIEPDPGSSKSYAVLSKGVLAVCGALARTADPESVDALAIALGHLYCPSITRKLVVSLIFLASDTDTLTTATKERLPLFVFGDGSIWSYTAGCRLRYNQGAWIVHRQPPVTSDTLAGAAAVARNQNADNQISPQRSEAQSA